MRLPRKVKFSLWGGLCVGVSRFTGTTDANYRTVTFVTFPRHVWIRRTACTLVAGRAEHKNVSLPSCLHSFFNLRVSRVKLFRFRLRIRLCWYCPAHGDDVYAHIDGPVDCLVS